MIAYARMNRERFEVYDESAYQVCNVHIGSDASVVGNTTRTVSIKRD